MKPVILAVLLLLAVASLVSGAPTEVEISRQRRLTCDHVISGLVGDWLCNQHCQRIGKGSGTCRGGTCYCSG